MTFTAKNRVFGEDVAVVCSNLSTGAVALSNWKTLSCKIAGKKRACRAASSPVAQQKVFPDMVTGSLKGYVSAGESMPELPQVGDVVKSFTVQTVTEGADLLPTITAFGDIVVTDIDYSQSEEAGDYNFSFESTGFTS